MVFAAVLCVIVGAIGLGGKYPAQANPLLTAIGFSGAIALAVAAFKATPSERQGQTAWKLAVLLPVAFFLTAVGYPIYQGSRPGLPASLCMSNAEQLVTAMTLYSSDNDDHLPLANRWRTSLFRYGDRGLRCPVSESPFSYSMNILVSEYGLGAIPEPNDTVLVFESKSDHSDSFGGPDIFFPRHDENGSVCFADGRARLIDRDTAATSKWSP